MTILALEFSSARRSVALARDGRVLAEASETGERGTNAFGLIEGVLAAANVGREEVAVLAAGLGPGSYAGIRVALAIAQGWELAREVKLIGISSVECLAAQAQAANMFGRVMVVIDAQRGEFYRAIYEISEDTVREVEPLKIVPAPEVQAHHGEGKILIGPEAVKWFPTARILFPSAAMLAKLAARQDPFSADVELTPIYLRETNFMKIPARNKR